VGFLVCPKLPLPAFGHPPLKGEGNSTAIETPEVNPAVSPSPSRRDVPYLTCRRGLVRGEVVDLAVERGGYSRLTNIRLWVIMWILDE
jgi:hypothetical protein